VVMFSEEPAGSTKAATITSQHASTSPRNRSAMNSGKPQITSPRFTLPGELTQPSFTLASFGGRVSQCGRRQVRARQRSKPFKQANTAAGTVAQNSQVSPAAAPPGKYTGEPISVNLKDVDLRDFFRLIHEIKRIECGAGSGG